MTDPDGIAESKQYSSPATDSAKVTVNFPGLKTETCCRNSWSAAHTANISAACQCQKRFPPVLIEGKFAVTLAESVEGELYCLLSDDAIEIGHMSLIAGIRQSKRWRTFLF